MAGNLRHAIVALPLLAALAGCATSSTSRLATTVDRQRQADRAYVEGNLAQALSGYQSLTRAMPQNADFWFRLGNVYARLKHPDEAVDAYQHALAIEPGHAKAWHNLGIIRLRQAEAAFGQSANTAAGIDPGLQKDSAGKAREIAALRSTANPDDAPASGSAAPAPDGAAASTAGAGP
jgi:cytochrome c-type biogenesis protein CcmH/NrfG